MYVQKEVPKYQCHKQVWALEIASVERDAVTKVCFKDTSYTPILVSYSWDQKHNPQPGDYYVMYEDGYTSVSPPEAFLSGYTLIKE